MDAAAELSAMVVVVEHRFFGTSIPEGWNATNGLSLLTMEQAVADLAVFRDKFQRMVLAPQGQSENVWITVGCGYAGALATWARTKHPHHFHRTICTTARLWANTARRASAHSPTSSRLSSTTWVLRGK
jgi:pimeloyl-ACP methyl ester carboxylesterase